jgi:hypothetical protein
LSIRTPVKLVFESIVLYLLDFWLFFFVLSGKGFRKFVKDLVSFVKNLLFVLSRLTHDFNLSDHSVLLMRIYLHLDLIHFAYHVALTLLYSR